MSVASRAVAVVGAWVIAALVVAGPAGAHCDTMDGPVVKDAQAALEKGNATAVLKWVSPKDEAELTAAFKKALAVRGKGPEAKELADQYFFETLVRVHRAGEGAPYTGLKPTGTDPGPAVKAADEALEHGSVDGAVKLVGERVADGIRQRYNHVAEARKHADDSVEAGRRFVAAYVEFTHYVERLFETAGAAGHAGHETHDAAAAPALPAVEAAHDHQH